MDSYKSLTSIFSILRHLEYKLEYIRIFHVSEGNISTYMMVLLTHRKFWPFLDFQKPHKGDNSLPVLFLGIKQCKNYYDSRRQP